VFEFAQWLQSTAVSVKIQSVTWAIPLLQSIHILTIGIVFVAILMIALRVLGRMRMDEPFLQVWNRFAIWMWGGLLVMSVTGVLLLIGEPIRQIMSLSFWLKMMLLAVGVASAAAFSHRLKPARGGGQEPEFSSASKSAAVLTLVLWLAIIFLGRAIAYDIEVWGSFSLAPGA
jgi:prepilin signal peptidase PulO-like enzyme (type II secretory pathway)